MVLTLALEQQPQWAFGTRDFIQYWSAFQLWQSGANPFDALQVLRLQERTAFPGPIPVLMWNPPWLLTILSPILNRSFQSAAQLWVICNALLFLLIAAAASVLARTRAK